MRGWFVQILLIVAGFCSSIGISPGIAQAEAAREKAIREEATEVEDRHLLSDNSSSSVATSSNSDRLIQPEAAPPATSVTEWAEQIAQSLVQITGVQVNSTEAGIEVVLQTAQGELTPPTMQTVGNALIADIPNAVLSEGEFSQANPVEGIALVNVTGLPGDRVRVAITGTDAPPVAEVRSASPSQGESEGQSLVFRVVTGTVAAGEEEAIELVVTGEQDEGYNPSNASTATRTDTPLRDIPQSIQVVPRQVLEDRNVRSLFEGVETVSGVIDGADAFGSPAQGFIIRGFNQGGNFRNGYRDVDRYALTSIDTIERVEVLRGPASVLFGAVEPGGIINVITRQPLSEPYYNLAFEAGNRELYQPSIDLSGPLTTDETVLYRFIASYQSSGGFQDFVNTDLVTIAPSITLNFGDRTDLNLYYEYINFSGVFEQYTSVLSDNSLLPRSFYQAYPDDAFVDNTTQKFGYVLNHELSDNWQLRNNFSVAASRNEEKYTIATSVVNDQSLTQFAQEREYPQDNYFGQIDLLGEFNTGAISHQLLVGFDFNRNVEIFQRAIGINVPDLDIFNPDYDIPDFNYGPTSSTYTATQSYGVYLQDQVALLDNLKLLIGGRFDWISVNETSNGVDSPEQNDTAFSPRIGLVYQPSDTISLYASYSQSFLPTSGFSQDNQPFEPTRGTQYEVGIKADFLDGDLSTTLAAYNLTRSNVETPDPENPDFSIQVGEQRSQGIELDIGGEILTGWNLIASYAYTDAETTKDNVIEEGNRLTSVPENQASLWTTYELQQGDLRGLGFGLGLFYIGERQGDLDNSFVLPDYLRTDAAIYYRRGRLNTAINIRNLFNTDYIRTSDGSSTFLRRGAPFTIVGSISWEF